MSQLFTAPDHNLATIARETGYPVVEVPGWTTRHHGPFAAHVGATVCHHTAGADPGDTSSNFPSLRAVRDGVPGLAGPLSNYGLGFDGTIYVIASGTCWHAGRGGWAGMARNSECIGIEAEDAGDGDWAPEQQDCYPRLCAVICQFLGVGAHTVCGHKEWAEPPGRKIDPAGIDMPSFRDQVQYYLDHPDQINRSGAGSPDQTQEDDMGMVPIPAPMGKGWHVVGVPAKNGGSSGVVQDAYLNFSPHWQRASDIKIAIYDARGNWMNPEWGDPVDDHTVGYTEVGDVQVWKLPSEAGSARLEWTGDHEDTFPVIYLETRPK